MHAKSIKAFHLMTVKHSKILLSGILNIPASSINYHGG